MLQKQEEENQNQPEFDMDDDPTGMDFGDFEDLDLSDPTALYAA